MSSPRARLAAWLAVGALGGALTTGVVVSQLGVAAASPHQSAYAPMTGYDGQGWGHRMRDGMGPDDMGPGGVGPGGMGFRGGPGGLGRLLGLGPGAHALHGEVTVQTAAGKTEQVVFQIGTVSKVVGPTVTVRSADGFSATYTVGSGAVLRKDHNAAKLSDIKAKDQVRLIAVRTGSTLTLKGLRDGKPPTFAGRPGTPPTAPPAQQQS